MQPNDPTIEGIRSFNRFYTRQLGLLDQGLLGSPFTLTESRVLYELAHRDHGTATELAQTLQLDLGYLSRLLKKFERQGYLERSRSTRDARQRALMLTAAGRRVFEPLNRAARDQVATMLDPLSETDRAQLLEAMHTVQRLLQPPERAPVTVRALRIGDLGWIVHRQGLLYAQEYGWDQSYEGLVAEILGQFSRQFDPEHEQGWVAEQAGVIVGSVFLVRASEQVAKLRLLYVEPATRGLGVGRRLVEHCVAFAREKGYRTLTLWTNDVLVSARRIYETVGFRLVSQESHHSFGKNLVGQTWELTL